MKCLFEHGPLLFDIIGGGQQVISGERLKTLGKILGITDEYMNEVSEQIDMNYASVI